MRLNHFLNRLRPIFFREGFLYLLIVGVVFLCVDVPSAVQTVKIRELNDESMGINIPQLYFFSKGQIAASAVNWKRLINYFNLVLKFFPSQEDAELFLGYCEYYGPGDKQAALDHILHSANTVPYYFWNIYSAGTLLFTNGDMDHAILYFEMALLLHPDKAVMTVLNSIVYRQLFAGIENLELESRYNGARQVSVLLLSAANYYKKNYDMAELFALKGVTEPGILNREPFYFYAGAIARAKGNDGEALSFLDQAVKAHSKNPLVYLYEAEILKKTGHSSKAQKFLQKGQALSHGLDLNKFPYPEYLRLEIF